MIMEVNNIKLVPLESKISNGDLMTLEEFSGCCECGGFIDYDGFGDFVITKNDELFVMNDTECKIVVQPSSYKELLETLTDYNITHILWYNR